MNTKEKLIALVAEVTTPFLAGVVGSHLAERGVKVPVLCEDCDHLRYSEEGETYCAVTWLGVEMDDYCSYGRRKDNECKDESTWDF